MKFMIIDNSDITFLECEPEEAVLQVKKRIREDFCTGKSISRIEIIRSNLNLGLGVYGEFSAVVYFTDGSINGSIKSFQVLPDPNFHVNRVHDENTPVIKDIVNIFNETNAVRSLGFAWNDAILDTENEEYFSLLVKNANPLLKELEDRALKEEDKFLGVTTDSELD